MSLLDTTVRTLASAHQMGQHVELGGEANLFKPLSADVTMACACGGEPISFNDTKPDCHAELALKKCLRCGSTCCAVLSIYGKAVSWDYQDHLVAQSWFNSMTLNRADELYRSVMALQSVLEVPPES